MASEISGSSEEPPFAFKRGHGVWRILPWGDFDCSRKAWHGSQFAVGSKNKQCKEDPKKKQQTHLWPARNADWIRVAGTCDLWGVDYSAEAKMSVAAVPHANPALQSQPTDDSSVWVPVATQHGIIACNKQMHRIKHVIEACFEFLPVCQ